eukprot:m.34997 g.34997  ORF g.34997 m.34997 type:complete len:363 (-) comp9839_c1_seq1:477-1565(-)
MAANGGPSSRFMLSPHSDTSRLNVITWSAETVASAQWIPLGCKVRATVTVKGRVLWQQRSKFHARCRPHKPTLPLSWHRTVQLPQSHPFPTCDEGSPHTKVVSTCLRRTYRPPRRPQFSSVKFAEAWLNVLADQLCKQSLQTQPHNEPHENHELLSWEQDGNSNCSTLVHGWPSSDEAPQHSSSSQQNSDNDDNVAAVVQHPDTLDVTLQHRVPVCLRVVVEWFKIPSLSLELTWSWRLMYLIARVQRLIKQTNWLSTLGGAHSQLGQHSKTHAFRAGTFALELFKLACVVGDAPTQVQCLLFFVSSLHQQGRTVDAQAAFRVAMIHYNALPQSSRSQKLRRLRDAMYSNIFDVSCGRITTQ